MEHRCSPGGRIVLSALGQGAEIERTLAGISLLRNLPDGERRAIESRCCWRRFAPHEQIIDCDSDTRDVFFVVNGRVRVVNYSVSGREISFVDIGPGGYFGELAAIDGQPRSANVIARERTLTASLAPRHFIKLLTDHPAVSIAVMRALAGMIRQASRRIMDLSTLGAHNRVQAEVLRLAKEMAPTGNTAAIRPKPLHVDIASRVSTTRETVARVLGDLNRSGLLRRDGDALIVLDLDRLSEMVEDFEEL